MFRLLGVLLTVLFAIATAIVVWPQFFRVEQLFPVAQLVAMRGVLIAGYLALAVLMLLLLLARPLRGFAASILVVALLGALAHGTVLYLRGVGPGALPEKSDGSIRVMTWNTNGEAVSAAEIAATIVEQDADVVALPETADSVGREIALMLRESGHRMWVHHVDFYPDVVNGPQAWQTTILISPDLGDYSVIDSSLDRTSNTGQVPSAVVMPVDGTGPTIVAVHAVAPRQSAMDQWRADLQWVADQCPSGDVILAGDFNATIDHTASLGTRGGDMGACFDVAARTGTGQAGTWPTTLPSLLGAPIDRILATANWHPEGSLVLGDDGGSDHRALVVQLSPAE
ncbi:endonuclease/exonuclease/phosphatase family protein [Microbacterium sp. NIBRBAC000506063]|uniref:endonuclease/exonuclease/phosphatase family protein n=1 Tax=Microbacterium sp. NIBRBAC000506063 TaxID=2734618 RepID=UPI001BB5C110|nr:endonuclease/exonuclease/phosphatase family protein [Microbacterium sp. NIBRBAC000506063]QTV79822.1 endonuclease/exonuclease/phosphatase family protein [Microbacterium sp. NIBRBAC000506063]